MYIIKISTNIICIYMRVCIPCNLFFPKPLNVTTKKTFPIYHSFKRSIFYRNVNPYGFGESLYDAPSACMCVHYFYLETQYEVFIRL